MADVTLEVTSTQINTGIKKANAINGTASEINTKLAKADSALQEIPDTYVLKADVATINNQSLLNGGNIDIQGGTGDGLDVDLSNLSDAGKKVIDGQWVAFPETVALLSGVTFEMGVITDTNIDLSAHLPNDGKIYEVLLCSDGNTGINDSQEQVYIASDMTTFIPVWRNRARTSGSVSGGGNVILPVGLQRNITLRVSMTGAGTKSGNTFCGLHAYRRVGINE